MKKGIRQQLKRRSGKQEKIIQRSFKDAKIMFESRVGNAYSDYLDSLKKRIDAMARESNEQVLTTITTRIKEAEKFCDCKETCMRKSQWGFCPYVPEGIEGHDIICKLAAGLWPKSQ